ncbi:hypothetical protein LTR85_002703 [Meristemomyces frigidus]|nr:hypothetical protein LTR85_002703 [Meristemomyces frigidus]
MKVFTMLALAAGAYAATDQQNCKHKTKGGHTITAIEAFCSNTGIVVPSAYAANGKSSGGQKVGVRGNCSPGQWVPQKYCLAQLYHMCATSPDDHGNGVTKYGRNNCQDFYISGNINP